MADHTNYSTYRKDRRYSTNISYRSCHFGDPKSTNHIDGPSLLQTLPQAKANLHGRQIKGLAQNRRPRRMDTGGNHLVHERQKPLKFWFNVIKWCEIMINMMINNSEFLNLKWLMSNDVHRFCHRILNWRLATVHSIPGQTHWGAACVSCSCLCHRDTPDSWFIELDDGKIYRKALYLMVKTMVSG